jgi:biopolymer transport protein ExbD
MAEQSEKLSAAQRGKIRRLSAPKELSPDEEGGELNIVPFLDIITNVLMFVLATVSVTFTATIDSFPPKRGGRGGPPPDHPSLNLTVIVVPEGFSIKGSGASIATGCEGTGSGITVPRAANDYDYAGLNACVKKLKGASDTAKDETTVTISANPSIPYQVVISTIDAVRKDDQGQELFPDVQFGLAR